MAKTLITPKLMLSTADLKKLRGTSSYWTAYREMKLMQDTLGKRSIKSLTIYDYSHYHQVPVDQVLSVLGRRPVPVFMPV
jgi:hypothetical protein